MGGVKGAVGREKSRERHPGGDNNEETRRDRERRRTPPPRAGVGAIRQRARRHDTRGWSQGLWGRGRVRVDESTIRRRSATGRSAKEHPKSAQTQHTTQATPRDGARTTNEPQASQHADQTIAATPTPTAMPTQPRRERTSQGKGSTTDPHPPRK